MRLIAGLVFSILLFSFSSQADTVTTATCNLTHKPVGGPSEPTVSQSSPTACDITQSNPDGSGGDSSASILSSLSSPGAATSPIGARLTASAASIGGAPVGGAEYGEATASGAATLTLYTLGPVRSGLIQFSEDVSLIAGFDDPIESASIAVGALQTHCGNAGTLSSGIVCDGNLGNPSGNVPQGGPIPFRLGQTFTFSEAILIDASSFAGALHSNGTGQANFSFTLLEADGTPVQVFAVPEPGTFMLLSVAVCGLLAIRPKYFFSACSINRDTLSKD